MNCQTCQFELSQCLDGRLPSGRRAIVMQHLSGCDACATFWTELQAAQELALRLHKHHVTSGFREQLWERIQAGEGTPEAVFRQPVPIAAKVRYVLTGAAAAAAVLLAAMLWRDHEASAPQSPRAIARTEAMPAEATSEPSHPAALAGGPSRLMPRPVPDADFFGMGAAGPSMLTTARPLTTDLIAIEATKQFERTYDFTTRVVERLPQEPDQERAADEILRNADTLRDLGAVLLELRDANRLSFNTPQIDADLRLVVRTLDKALAQRRDLDTVRMFIAPILGDAKNLVGMTKALQITPAMRSDEQLDLVLRLSQSRPQAFPKLFVMVGADTCDLEELNPMRNPVFMLQDHCGTRQFALPRSAVEEGEIRMRVLRVEKHLEIQVGNNPR